MGRYIDADKTLAYISRLLGGLPLALLNECEKNGIDIVRCKECRWRKQDKSCDLNCRIDYIDGTEADMWFYTEDDDFCSYGERSSE